MYTCACVCGCCFFPNAYSTSKCHGFINCPGWAYPPVISVKALHIKWPIVLRTRGCTGSTNAHLFTFYIYHTSLTFWVGNWFFQPCQFATFIPEASLLWTCHKTTSLTMLPPVLKMHNKGPRWWSLPCSKEEEDAKGQVAKLSRLQESGLKKCLTLLN